MDASPRDSQNNVGAYEASLVRNPVTHPERPPELLRTAHSFDAAVRRELYKVSACCEPKVRAGTPAVWWDPWAARLERSADRERWESIGVQQCVELVD
jgi:hypothetical protein